MHGMLPYILSEVTSYVAFAIVFYLSWRFVRAYERRSIAPEQLRVLTTRIALLEESVGEVEARVTDTMEAQRFRAELFPNNEVPLEPRDEIQGLARARPRSP